MAWGGPRLSCRGGCVCRGEGDRREALLERGWCVQASWGRTPWSTAPRSGPAAVYSQRLRGGGRAKWTFLEFQELRVDWGGGLLPAPPWFPRRGLLSSVAAQATSTRVVRGPLGTWPPCPLHPGSGLARLDLRTLGGLTSAFSPTGPSPSLWVLRGQAGRSPAVLRVGRGREHPRGLVHSWGRRGGTGPRWGPWG